MTILSVESLKSLLLDVKKSFSEASNKKAALHNPN